MSYLLDKKVKRKKFIIIVFAIFFVTATFYFRLAISDSLSYASHAIFRPFFIFSNNFGGKLASVGSFFASKNSLLKENDNLKSQLNINANEVANYESILAENISLKEILGRKNETRPNGSSGREVTMTLSVILSKPNQSLYDTLIIDAGAKEGLEIGDMVFALGNVPIGRIKAVYLNSSKVVLFSNSGEKTQVIVGTKNTSLEVIGRGGGNFEMILPRDLTLLKGDQAILPGIAPLLLGVVETIISDPRDSFQKALLVSPVNIQELKFVQVEVSAR